MGLEPWFEKYAYIVKREDVSPSHTVGSKNRTPPASIYADLEIVWSPSHAVGSEHGIVFALSRAEAMSPSHTVGLEQKVSFVIATEKERSPSHTVGVELVTVVRNNTIRIENLSPSHTVGLELLGYIRVGI